MLYQGVQDDNIALNKCNTENVTSRMYSTMDVQKESIGTNFKVNSKRGNHDLESSGLPGKLPNGGGITGDLCPRKAQISKHRL